MFGRIPFNLCPLTEADLDEEVALEDLNPVPIGERRSEVFQRVRERQDLTMQRMKRKWDTVNTVVFNVGDKVLLSDRVFCWSKESWSSFLDPSHRFRCPSVR
eukprot:TRINITY_DN803_c0_g1_i18.p2 TRINITY_DN803_c0_g1~~TRINITY_DN803_c0_g1_i18.p2  ORF type:complete len:102 (+),score=7.72 TRINITY_DN803_c0_g1_i18:277-582(+)